MPREYTDESAGSMSADDSNPSVLRPIPPASPPPTQTRYMALRASEYFSPRHKAAVVAPSPGLQRAAVVTSSGSHGSRAAAVPAPGSQGSRPEVVDDDDRTSLISVSPASWGEDSEFTAAIRKKRTEALRRLERAEERFREQIRSRGSSTLIPVDDDDDEEEWEEEEEEEEEEEGQAESAGEDDDEAKEIAIMRPAGGSIIGYEEVEGELGNVEEDGTVQVERLEALVKEMLLRKGYRVTDQS